MDFTLTGTAAGGEFITGTAGNDVYNGLGGGDFYLGSAGNDVFNGDAGAYDQVNYTGSRSQYTFTRNANGSVTVVTPEGTDTLNNIDGIWFHGSQEWVSIADLLGEASENTPADPEEITSVETDDGTTITGTSGDDNVADFYGNNTINTGAGEDEIFSGNGNDTIDAGTGDDEIRSGNGDDMIWGGDGDDYILTDSDNTDATDGGNDQVDGGDGRDHIFTLEGDDIINGGEGNDNLAAGADNDYIDGGAGNDSLFGEEGQDILVGGTGNDFLSGGADADRFEFGNDFGYDVITDFDNTDFLDFSGYDGANSLQDVLSNAVQQDLSNGTSFVHIDFGDGNQLRVFNTTLEQLDEGAFIF